MFLKITPQSNQPAIQGETQDKTLPGAIEVKSFSWDVESPTTIGSATSGAGAGKAKLNPLKITKAVDATSPALLMAAGNGTAFKDVALVVRKAGATGPDAFLQYHLKTAVVTHIETSADSGDEGVTETVTFAYGAIQERYMPQSTTTGLAPKPLVNGWNQILNQPNTDAWSDIFQG
jgi:type VI secretion system secreted protein Hcp